MPVWMDEYLALLRRVLDEGVDRQDRTGTGTRSVFGHQMRFDLRESLPAVTTKRLHWPSIIHELLWFISGETTLRYLRENDIRIWDEWADPQGELGPIYGKQWRRWMAADGRIIDQLQRAIDAIVREPTSRRILVSAWNVGELDEMALMPCHAMFQFYVSGDEISCHLYQRSGDAFLGIPFNISSYSILTCMIAQITGLRPAEFIHSIGDTHLYSNHLDLARLQLERRPLPLPTLRLNPDCLAIDDFDFEHIEIVGYQHHPHISATVAV